MKSITRHTLLGLVLLAGCARGPGQEAGRPAAGNGSSPERAAETITAEDMRERIAFLASDSLRGRDTPSRGLEAAAAYIAQEFASLGLQPGGDSASFIQRYPYPLVSLTGGGVRLELLRSGRRTAFTYGRDYYVVPGAADTAVGSLVFLGTAGQAVASLEESVRRGQIPVIYLPGPVGVEWQRSAGRVLRAAEDARAQGVIFVLDPDIDAQFIERATASAAQPRRLLGGQAGVPAYFVRYTVAREFFQQAGLDLDELRRRAAQGSLEAVQLPGLTVAMGARVQVIEPALAPNVVGILPGSDPALRDTYVVFSAHMDHVGVGRPDERGDSIYNGADDNASGTAAVLEVAQAFASLSQRPPRSLVFLLVSGEEKGLLGSEWFVDHPTIPLDRVVANINVDMIGRNSPDSIVVIGQEYSSLGQLVHEVAARHPELRLVVAPDIWPEQRFFFRSDQFNFMRQEIPALFFFAGIHDDYHRPSDEVEKIDTDKAARVARLIFYTANEIATRAEPPAWTPQGLAEVRALTGGRR